MTLSEYLIEAIASRKTGKYSLKLIFPEGSTETEFQDAIDNLYEIKSRRFYTKRGASFEKIIESRTEKYNSETVVDFSIYPDTVQPTIIVIGAGPLAEGKNACVLRYRKESAYGMVKSDTPTSLLGVFYFEYDGKKWIRVSGPDLSSWGDPREHEEEINSMLTK